jgi:hypothetical protein
MSIDRRFSNFVLQLVADYRKFSPKDQEFVIEIDDIPVYELNEAVSILLEDEGYASEANGADNDAWENTMRPALLCAMRNRNTEAAQKEFAEIWMKCVRGYFDKKIQEELDDHIAEYNHDYGRDLLADDGDYVPCGHTDGQEARL